MLKRALPLLLLLGGCAQHNLAAELDAYQLQKVAAGYLRVDRSPEDAPISRAALAENYLKIALNREATGGQQSAAIPLTRWDGSIGYLTLGSGVDGATEAAIAEYLSRLEGVTGVRIRPREETPNGASLIVIVASEEEIPVLAGVSAYHARRAPALDIVVDFLRNPVAGSPCYGKVLSDAEGRIRTAFVLIRSETRGLLRQACIEEELAQVLGLINDDPNVRPSLFNDDQEFALLTQHDELLLRIHYDARLEPGMTLEEVRPRLGAIVRDLVP
ncbi:MAG: DUF2927 domain-containing protein [Pseudomonadota bacterium]